MSKHLVKAYKDGSESSRTSIHSHQSCWMSRWSQPPKQGSLVAPHSQTFSKEEGLDHNQKRLRTSLSISSDIPGSYGNIKNNTKAEAVGLDTGSLRIRAQNVGQKRSAFCFLGHSRNRENSWTRTPMDPSCIYTANSPRSTNICTNHDEADRKLISHLSLERKGQGVSNLSEDQGNDKCGNYSAILVHKRSNFSPFLSNMHIDYQTDAPSSFHGHQSLEGLPCPVRNVETVKICSHGRPPLYSQTTTHHVLFTSRMGVGRVPTQHRGVKIQPLWSSTDSERDNFGDAETPRDERSFDLSAETHTMDTVSLSNKNEFSGMCFPPVAQNTTRDKTLVKTSVDPWEDKVRGKMPVKETPTNTNSMDGVETSTSRTQSLETEHLFSCAEQPVNTKFFLVEPSETKSIHIDESDFQELSCKRLKLDSSNIGESSSHEKTHMFFSKSTKHSRVSLDTPPSTDDKHEDKESSIPSQKVGPMVNVEPSTTMTKNPIFQCSWIQRWCQVKDRHPSKSVVICEPSTSKLPLDELDKRQFPSIAAAALMGKSLDGFHACKFTKRGPLVFWNSEDY